MSDQPVRLIVLYIRVIDRCPYSISGRIWLQARCLFWRHHACSETCNPFRVVQEAHVPDELKLCRGTRSITAESGFDYNVPSLVINGSGSTPPLPYRSGMTGQAQWRVIAAQTRWMIGFHYIGVIIECRVFSRSFDIPSASRIGS